LSDPVKARKKAMDYLARREHGHHELLTKLTKFGFDANVAEIAIAELVNDGLQSDQRFVDMFIQSRIHQGKGPLRVRADLRERGIEDGMIDNGLAQAGQDWYALAREVWGKKFGPGRPEGFNEKARQMRFLQSRGFDAGQIQAAVSALDE
jgi:regulatory protein